MANIAAGFHKNGRYAESADALQGALRLDESNPRTWANLDTARYFQGRYLDAARAAEKAVERAPGRYLYWGNLGDNYRWAEGKKHLAGGAYRKAIELVREQIKLKPNEPALPQHPGRVSGEVR
jgi:serine/threonine-protein kinase